MPLISPEKLHQIGCEVLEAVGCTADDARKVVDHLVDSNLFGHDSHGAIRLPEYVRAITVSYTHLTLPTPPYV